MNNNNFSVQLISLLLTFWIIVPAFPQSRGLKTITEADLRFHLEFIAADELHGRETPSYELEITNRYLANVIKRYGLAPLMPDGSFFQEIPLTVIEVAEEKTKLRVISEFGEQVYYYARGFGGSFRSSGNFSGQVVFVGYGQYNPEHGWDDYGENNYNGKVVVILEGELPDTHPIKESQNRMRRNAASTARQKGAAAALFVISEEKERRMVAGENLYYSTPRGRGNFSYASQRTARRSRRPSPIRETEEQEPQRPPLPFGQAEIRHDVAAAILGITKNDLHAMFNTIKRGGQVPRKEIAEVHVELSIVTEQHPAYTRNVIGVIEGSDPALQKEYVVVCAHQDHLGIQGGEIMNGADDNGSGTVALLEIAQAFVREKPKRSIIAAWFSGEERGLLGSHYFVNNCPVPVEKISACLNMDMLCRNHPDSLYLVASDLLSSELDGTIHRMNKKYGINFGFDYEYSNRSHPQRVYYRSDQYPPIRFGIPSVWFFCGFTSDYHTFNDDLEFVDYTKMSKVAKLVYATAYEIGNRKDLLHLDVNTEVTSRGRHNLTIESIK